MAHRNLSAAELNRMPKRSAIIRNLNNSRYEGRNAAVNVKLAKDIKFYNELTHFEDGSTFLLHDSRTLEPNLDAILIFGSQESLIRLRQHRDWAGDGTFTVCPPSFNQLYTINVLIGNSSLVCVYMLTERRLQQTYERAFEKLQQLVGVGIDPDSFLTDFEKSAQNAVEIIWPATTLRSCIFHLGQSIWRHVQDLGLVPLYRDVYDVRVAVRSLTALAFLQSQEIPEGFRVIRQTIEPYYHALTPLFDYFSNTYVGSIGAPALFHPDSWTVHDAVENHLARSNNAVEGWHSCFKSKFNSAHPNLSAFIIAAKEEELDVKARLIRYYTNPAGGISVKKRLAKYVRIDETIEGYVQGFDGWDPATRCVLTHLDHLQNCIARY